LFQDAVFKQHKGISDGRKKSASIIKTEDIFIKKTKTKRMKYQRFDNLSTRYEYPRKKRKEITV